MKRGELDNVESHNDMIQLEEKSRRTRRELNRKTRSKNKNAHDDALSLSLSLSLVPRTGAKILFTVINASYAWVLHHFACFCTQFHHECGDADEAGDDDDAVVVVRSTSRT
mgnify:CR=1 FL=1